MGFEVVETSDLPTPGQFSHVVKKGNIVLSDPVTSVPLAIVDEHWSFSLRSTAATVVACRWMGPLDRATPLVLGLVGVGSMDFDTYDASDSASRITHHGPGARAHVSRAGTGRRWVGVRISGGGA